MSNTEESQRKLKIAYGNGRESKKWRNGEITWDEMCEKLRSTYRTRETVEEYQHMSSDERSAAKDNGAFVGGHLRDVLMLQDRSRQPACLLYEILRGKTVAGRKRGIDPLNFLP